MGLWFWAGVWVLAVVGYLWGWNELMKRIREQEIRKQAKETEHRMRATATTLALMVGLALPAVGETETHQIVEISHEELASSQGPITHHKIESRSGNLDTISTAINGYFLWVRYGDDPEVTVSVDVSDPSITSATIHLDGTVELVRESTEPTSEPESIDLVETYPQVDWESTFNKIRALGPVPE